MLIVTAARFKENGCLKTKGEKDNLDASPNVQLMQILLNDERNEIMLSDVSKVRNDVKKK